LPEDGATLIIDEGFTQFLSDFIKELGSQYLDQIGIRMLEHIDDEITNDIFLSKLGFPIRGIIDMGKYKKSFSKELSEGKIEIGSTDDRAIDIEFGTTSAQNANLKDSEVIEWAKRKKIGGRHYVRVGQRIARSIRRVGIAPKPALARSIDRTIGDNEEIVNRTIESLKTTLQ
jgi:hypothetical protein